MAYDLPQFVRELEKRNELKRIAHPVSATLEITEIADRAVKSGGPALLFENVRETPDVPLAIGLYGSDSRMSLALHDAPQNIAARIEGLIKTVPPEGLFGKLQTGLKLLPTAMSLGVKSVNDGPCKETKYFGDDVDLSKLPILTCWPQDGGPFITLPMVFTHNPNTGRRNVGMYRVQIYDRNTTGMHWQMHKVGAQHHREAQEKQQPIEAAVCLGGDPCLPFCAIAPLPEEIDEMMFAGFLRGKPVEMVKCETIDVRVPADCEYVIEGIIDPQETRPEGPFGDHTGYYTPIEPYPVFRVTCITQRKKPIYPATIVGIPPMEDAWLGGAVGTIFKPLIKTQIPELIDMHLPVEACFHNCAIVSIKKRYPHHAYKVMHALWGLGQLMFSKVIIVVDDDVDVHNLSEVLWRVTNNIDPARDVQIVKGPVDSLNHAAPLVGFGSKMGIDATTKWASEGHTREWPDVVKMDRATVEKVDAIWDQLGLGAKVLSPSVDGHIVAKMP
ncbi:MAG: 4-hydroxy-3-polyprenylbenzoate decarboxylase [Abditibacteriota bacterium]|nr:4-hydroxy-3-polyprenylbenzoate decarboxylase [Abditibacteriota bacterium]